MADRLTIAVKLLCNLVIFCCFIGLFSCNEIDRCPRQFSRDRYLRVHGDKCYRFVRNEVSWTSARNDCRRNGGQLITITRRDVQIFVERTLHEIWSKNGMWIGAHDRDSEMDWFWVTGERVKSGFQNWDSGQPSCFLLDFLCHEDCACLRIDEGYKWHDYLCDASMYRYGYACQYDLLPVPKTTTTTTTTTRKTTTTTTRKTTTTTTPTTTVLPTKAPTRAETRKKVRPTIIAEKTNLKNLNITAVMEESSAANTSVWSAPGNMINVESQRLISDDSTLKTGGMIGLVVSFLLVFIAGLIVGVFFCRRRYRKKYEETLNVGFNNVVYTAAPIHETQHKLKDNNVLALSAAGDSDDDDVDEHRYIDIDDLASGGQCVELPHCKDINRPVDVVCVKENIYDTVATHKEAGPAEDKGVASDADAPPPCPSGNFTQFAPEFLKKDTDVSQAYSNNLYGFGK